MNHVTRALLIFVIATFAVGVVDQVPAAASPISLVVSAGGPELQGPPALASFDLSFLFDVGMTVQSVTFGSNLGGPVQSLQDVDSTLPGSVTLRELSLLLDLSAQPDAFVLATVLFNLPGGNVADGLASIHLDPASLGLGDDVGNTLPLSLLRLSASDSEPPINTVPEPTTMVLLGSGIAAAIARRWQRSMM